ncbi:hypothetical protein BDR26DRAFT_957277 [Obelidium mucronatum]|nr:hypothetical protein BDR26DRAFT_957277 [Obelidium mucronatum]
MAVVKRRTLTRLIVFCAALGAALLSLRILRRPLRHTTHAAAGASADARLGAYDRAAVEFAPPRRRAHSAAPTPRAFAARAVDRVVLVARIAAAAGNASGLLPPQARAVLRSLFPQNALPELTSTDASWTISLDNSPVGLSVMLTCIDFGHACEPTCPANYKQHKNSIVSLIPIGCPKQIANVSSDIFDSWVTALETAPEHSHLLFVDESVVGFEKNWLHELS